MPCERCGALTGASEYIVTKGDAEVRRSFCETCAESTAETYPVKLARQPARPPKDETPPAATPSTSRGKKEEE